MPAVWNSNGNFLHIIFFLRACRDASPILHATPSVLQQEKLQPRKAKLLSTAAEPWERFPKIYQQPGAIHDPAFWSPSVTISLDGVVCLACPHCWPRILLYWFLLEGGKQNLVFLHQAKHQKNTFVFQTSVAITMTGWLVALCALVHSSSSLSETRSCMIRHGHRRLSRPTFPLVKHGWN